MELSRNFIKFFFKRRQLILRLLIVWSLGLFILYYDESRGFDIRFKLRSNQPVSKDIVLINISKDSWDNLIDPTMAVFLKKTKPLSDSYFWSTRVWKALLTTLNKNDPSLIMVDLFFDRSVPMSKFTESSFKLETVIWRAELSERFGYKQPRFAINIVEKNDMSELSLANVALGNIFRDYDYTARRYQELKQVSFLQDIPKKVSTRHLNKTMEIKQPAFINYRGGQNTYPTINLTDVLTESYPPNFFKNKIVLIGSNSMKRHFIKTPLGAMTRSEYNATIIDNIINDLWIKFLNPKLYYFYLFIITLACFLILYIFKQSIAIYMLILTGVSLISLSILAFDLYNLWLPIISPIAILVLSYTILLNFLLSKSEYQTWKSRKKEESVVEMNELKNNFVSLFSHDLKTPLAKIHAISDTAVSQSETSETTKKNFLKIKKEARELDRYIQSILQITRIEAGEFNLDLAPQDINELINECIDLLSPLALVKNIYVGFDEEPLFPVEIDTKLIKEVILNLLDNAIKYCPKGSKIVLESSDDEDYCEIKISDNGPGIHDEDQKSIFDKFYQPKTNDSNKKGTGLGLYLVRYFIEIHDGTVDLKSRVGFGSTFSIRLPYVHKNKGVKNV